MTEADLLPAPAASVENEGADKDVSLAEIAYRGLRELVRNGTYAPGQMFSENQVAERLRVGRTPVREAVSRLAHEGLLVRMPKRGVIVAMLSADDVRELYEVHSALEGLCVRTAIERGEGRRLAAELSEIVDAAEARVVSGIEWDEYSVEDRRFHSTLWAAGHSRRAADLLAAASDAAILDPWHRQLRDVEGQQQRSLAEHRAVIAAIASGDPSAAEDAVRAHHRSYQRQLARRLFGSSLNKEDA